MEKSVRRRLRGQCFCGHLQFEMTRGPASACHCHCESCQRASGAAFVTWVTFPAEAFLITKGALQKRHSSPKVVRGHCAVCGTTVSYQSDRSPGEIDITATCLDQPGTIKPASHIWTEDKQPWVVIGDDLPRHERWSSED